MHLAPPTEQLSGKRNHQRENPREFQGSWRSHVAFRSISILAAALQEKHIALLLVQPASSLQQWAQEEDELGEDEFVFFPPSFPRSPGWHRDGLGARATPRPALFLVCAQKADNGD